MLRFPLQTGRDAFGAAVGAAFLAGGVAIPALVTPFVQRDLVLPASFVATIAGLAAVGLLLRARNRRASDLIVDEEGARIDAGMNHGLRFSWKEMGDEPGGVHVEESERIGTDGERVVFRTHRFLLFGVPIAETEDALEADSFEALLETLRAARRGKRSAEDPVLALPPSVVRCETCGGALTPADADEITCAHCSARSTLPAALRDRVRAAAAWPAARARLDDTIARVLRAPTAPMANRFLLAASLVLVAAPVAAWGAKIFWALALPAVGLLGVARLIFVDRQARRLIGVRFAATRAAGEGWTCRACNAPLPPTSTSIVRCAYCESDNVLGMDLCRPLGAVVTEASDLEAALAFRRQAVIQAWAVLGAVCAGLLVMALK